MLAGLGALATCAPFLKEPTEHAGPPPPDLSALLAAMPMTAEPASASVSRIVERRCVVCHGCYDAPCQLKLSSPDGLARGASKQNIYDTERLSDAPPTRLGIDAQSVPEWRALGFHPVAAGAPGTAPDASPMARLLALARANPPDADAPLPDAVELDINRPLSCPAPDEVAGYAAAMPHGGMPYGMAPLADYEFAVLAAWTLSAEPLPRATRPMPPRIAAQVAEWELFLNGTSPRQQLVSRYLYEHLFLAHLHFEGDGPDRFFRLIRSATPSGTAPREIATRRPYDDPGSDFHYRLMPVEETIIHKDHIVYTLGPARLARLRALFLEPLWSAGPLPPYGTEAGASPFRVFAAIPAESRYRFLLEDALFFVRSFIRGPVCHGQVATDVIEDRFWVAFLAPERDLSITDPDFLPGAVDLLKLPAETARGTIFERLWPILHDGHRAWLRYRDARYAESPAHKRGFGLEAIWDGGSTNRQALLTVFRNHDNASVVPGFVGAVPETAWVIDYPVFERIYYDLVAGYDVFGSVESQLTTRLYMDHLRREGEDLFLSFLPAAERRALHAEWYRGPLAEIHASWTARRSEDARPAAIAYETDDPKAELLLSLLARGGDRWPTDDPINRCSKAACGEGSTVRTLSELASRTGAWVKFLPDLTLLRVASADGTAEVFSLFRDKEHSNVALLLAEEARHEPERDTVTVLPGQVGSYPNFFLDVAASDLAEFADALMAMRDQTDWLALVARHGVRRTSPRFWAVADAMQDDLIGQDPLHAGLLDLNRYADPKPDGAPD